MSEAMLPALARVRYTGENTEKLRSAWLQAKKSRANLGPSRVCFSVLGLLGSPSLCFRDRKKVVGLDDEHVLAAAVAATVPGDCGPSVKREWIEREAH